MRKLTALWAVGRSALVILACMMLAACSLLPGRVVDVSVDDDPFMGDADAPNTIILFEDFECPYCLKFTTETLPILKAKYVDTHKARIVFRDYPVPSSHPHAMQAARAAHCAYAQGKFWEYHDILFSNPEYLRDTDLQRYATVIKLDPEQFASCLTDEATQAEIDNDIAAGRKAGVRGTPSAFVNGVLLAGAQPIEAFDALLTPKEETK